LPKAASVVERASIWPFPSAIESQYSSSEDRLRYSLSNTTKLHNVLGNQVRILLHSPGDLVEQFAQSHEMGPFDVPVGV
jgi:hypothetical protein